MAGQAKASILYAENDEKVLTAQGESLKKAGYPTTHVVGRVAAEQALKQGSFELMILGHTLSKDDRHHLPYKARKANENMLILVLHASGNHPAVDMAMDSRQGPDAVLKAVASLLAQKVAAAVAR